MQHLIAVKWRNDRKLVAFYDEWIHVLTGMKSQPRTEDLQAIFHAQVRQSQRLKYYLDKYDEALEGQPERTYQFLVDAVLKRMERDRELENSRAVSEAISGQAAMPATTNGGEKGAPAKGGGKMLPRAAAASLRLVPLSTQHLKL